MINYYTTIQVLHLAGMAAWFGSALAVALIWTMAGRTHAPDTQKILLEIITRIEIPASFFMPLTGFLLMVDQPGWLTVGWLHVKILIGFAAIGFSHISRRKLIKIMDGNTSQEKVFGRLRSGVLVAIGIIIIIVGYN